MDPESTTAINTNSIMCQSCCLGKFNVNSLIIQMYDRSNVSSAKIRANIRIENGKHFDNGRRRCWSIFSTIRKCYNEKWQHLQIEKETRLFRMFNFKTEQFTPQHNLQKKTTLFLCSVLARSKIYRELVTIFRPGFSWKLRRCVRTHIQRTRQGP